MPPPPDEGNYDHFGPPPPQNFMTRPPSGGRRSFGDRGSVPGTLGGGVPPGYRGDQPGYGMQEFASQNSGMPGEAHDSTDRGEWAPPKSYNEKGVPLVYEEKGMMITTI